MTTTVIAVCAFLAMFLFTALAIAIHDSKVPAFVPHNPDADMADDPSLPSEEWEVVIETFIVKDDDGRRPMAFVSRGPEVWIDTGRGVVHHLDMGDPADLWDYADWHSYAEEHQVNDDDNEVDANYPDMEEDYWEYKRPSQTPDEYVFDARTEPDQYDYDPAELLEF